MVESTVGNVEVPLTTLVITNNFERNRNWRKNCVIKKISSALENELQVAILKKAAIFEKNEKKKKKKKKRPKAKDSSKF